MFHLHVASFAELLPHSIPIDGTMADKQAYLAARYVFPLASVSKADTLEGT
jgi:hypothetical protein